MLTVVLSTATASLFGVADFLGGWASRRESAIAVTATSHSFGVLLFGIGVVLMPAAFVQADVIAGLAAGITGGMGVVALYGALARGRMSLVAPLTAALSGSLPAVYDLVRGSQVGPLSLAGLALALLATVVASATSSEDPLADVTGTAVPAMPPIALGLSLLAGLGFAGSFVSFSFASETSGLWPVLFARITSAGVLTVIAVTRNRRLGVSREALPATVGAGVLDAAANVTMLTAIRLGPLAVASVIGSLYPVITIVLARIVLREHLRGIQRAAIGLALIAVVLSALR